MKVFKRIEKKEQMLIKVLLGNENLFVTPASNTEKILEEPKYEQISKKNFWLWSCSLSPLNTTTLGMTRTRLKSVTSSNQSLKIS